MIRNFVNRFFTHSRHSVRQPVRLQYISDLHVDVNKKIPQIKPVCDHLAICGDIGKPDHPHFSQLINQTSKLFKNVYLVAGNHDYDCGPQFERQKVIYYKPLIKDICKSFTNVHFLDRSIHQLNSDTIVAGTTLWSHPHHQQEDNYMEHIFEHTADVEWIKNLIKDTHNNHKIIMLTHFVPTFKLIEEKYQKKGLKSTSWFATDLEDLIKEPIIAWLCGHSHSIIDLKVNNIYCGINAIGYHPKKIDEIKFINV